MFRLKLNSLLNWKMSQRKTSYKGYTWELVGTDYFRNFDGVDYLLYHFEYKDENGYYTTRMIGSYPTKDPEKIDEIAIDLINNSGGFLFVNN